MMIEITSKSLEGEGKNLGKSFPREKMLQRPPGIPENLKRCSWSEVNKGVLDTRHGSRSS